MISSQVYIAAVIVILAVLAALLFFVAKKRQRGRLTPLAGVAFGFILAGLFFGDDRMIGDGKDQLQLKFLHVNSGHRNKGLGKQLFYMAADEARKRGAARMYVSATPAEHTIDFYLRLGCKVTAKPDPELFALEPKDIHLEYDLASNRQ